MSNERRRTEWMLLAAVILAACTNEKEPELLRASPEDDGDAGNRGSRDGRPAVDGGSTEKPAADPFQLVLLDDVRISSHDTDPNFQKASADLDLGAGPFSRVTLEVALSSTCYPFENWTQEPPPEGHNFPPSCDAFDRNFEITWDEPESDGDPPAFELLRAITPFGGPLDLEVDLTDLANAEPGRHRIQAFIATWSDAEGQVTGAHGGWNLSLRLQVVPGSAPRPVLAALPLLNGSLGPGQEAGTISFETPEATSRLEIAYRATGHGGGTDPTCFGPAEEFCERTHVLSVDGRDLESYMPFRSDCASLCTLKNAPNAAFQYCEENPTGAIRSVRAPRAGWCPGDESAPHWITLADVEPGSHTFGYRLDPIAEAGSWRVSATLFAFAD